MAKKEKDNTTRFDVWESFQKTTGYFEDVPPDPSRRYCVDDYPGPYKRYDDAKKRIRLEKTDHADFPTPLGRALADRRSKRNFLKDPLTMDELSFLLWATQGITARLEGYELRTSPSAGALYPVETYLAVRAVEALEPGIWHYHVKDAELEWIREGDVAAEAARASGDQVMVELASVNFIWTAVLERTCCKYYERGFRYVYEDVGHISQSLQIAAAGLTNVGCAVIGSFYDDRAARLLGVNLESEPVVMMGSVGRVSGAHFLEDRRTYMEKLGKARAEEG
ncbi:MAG: SagB/ThcOx family dehydrogenase [Planctomycetota bacterium]